MLILGLLGMYIDAAVVFFTKSSFFFRMAMAVLWAQSALATKTLRPLHVSYQPIHIWGQEGAQTSK